MRIPIFSGNVPSVTAEQMIEVDRAMMQDLHIELIQMMENAGLALARLARERFFAGDPRAQPVMILAGPGGNGGGALACARRLHTWGARVEVVVRHPSHQLASVPAHQLEIIQRLQIPISSAEAVKGRTSADSLLLIDGLIGYRLHGTPQGSIADLIRWANGQPGPILSLDVPSGVDSTTGRVFAPAIKATATLTLALPKAGLLTPDGKAQSGELYLADIGVPPALYARPPLALQVGFLFAPSEILRLR